MCTSIGIKRKRTPHGMDRMALACYDYSAMESAMIESIQFRNFKALRDTVLPLGRLTLIVGANGSGKSTAMQALETVKGPGPVDLSKTLTIGSARTDHVEVVLNWGAPYNGRRLSP